VLEGIVCQALMRAPTARARLLARDHGADAGDSKPDSRRQDPPDLRIDAGRPGEARMQTANQSLASLYMKRLITLETAMTASSNKDELQDMINRGVGVVAGAGLGRTAGSAAARPTRT